MIATSTAESGVHKFTIEHVRVLVDPHDAQAVALSLVAGIVPFRADGGGLDDAMAWFGGSLVAINPGVRALENHTRFLRYRNTVQALDTRTNQVPVCVLDLLRIKHTAAAREHADGGSTLFGAATLTATPQPHHEVHISLGGTDAAFGQLNATFTAANASQPAAGLSALKHATKISVNMNPPICRLADIIGGREGGEAGVKVSKAKTFARYEPDAASIWSLTPQLPGHDIIFDTFHTEYADTPVYRVFKAAPAPRRTR